MVYRVESLIYLIINNSSYTILNTMKFYKIDYYLVLNLN